MGGINAQLRNYNRAVLYTAIAMLSAIPFALSDVNAQTLITSCESDKGIAVTWGQKVEAKRLKVNRNSLFITHGKASIHLWAKSSDAPGNQYIGMKFTIPPTDLMHAALAFDAGSMFPETTNALYVRLYDRDGRCAGSWVNWHSPFERGNDRMRTFVLRYGASRAGFTFEARLVKVQPTAVVAIEFIIGTAGKGVEFDVFVDNIRTAPLPKSWRDVKVPKRLHIRTQLTAGGKPNFVLVPPDDSPDVVELLRACIRRFTFENPSEVNISLRDYLRKRARLPDTIFKEHIVALGHAGNNVIIYRLYAHGYTAVDSLFPGDGGYVVQVVHDPWGTGKNVIVIGASDDEGLRAGIRRFGEILTHSRIGVLGRLYEVSPSGEVKRLFRALTIDPDEHYIEQQLQSARRRLETGAHGGLAPMIADAGMNYAITGKRGFAILFKRLVTMWYDHYRSNPATYGGPWGMDADFSLYRIIPAWDVVEESDALTDDDRMFITRVLFEFIETDCLRKARARSNRVRHNHQTFPALGLYYAGEYFRKYYGIDEAEIWLDAARNVFEFQATAFKPYEDCNGYQWLTLRHVSQYALASGDYRFFESGNAWRAVTYAIACMDNIGYQVPYGDTGSFQCWWSEIPFLRMAYFYYRSPLIAAVLKRKLAMRSSHSLYEFTLPLDNALDLNVIRYNAMVHVETPHDPLTAQRAEQLMGAICIPVDIPYFHTFGGEKYVPIERSVDKVIFRDNFDPAGAYLLLDGLSRGGHGHYDANTICRITWHERIWLADNDYFKSQAKFHNGALVWHNGESDTPPSFCEWLASSNTDALSYAHIVLRNYANTHWHRRIFWVRSDEFFIIADTFIALEDGDYAFRITWQCVGDPVGLWMPTSSKGGAGIELEQRGVRFVIKGANVHQCSLDDDEEQGANWRGYKFAKPIVRVFRELTRTHLSKGEAVTIFNVLSCKPYRANLQGANYMTARLGTDITIRAIGRHTAVISIANKPWIVAVADAQRKVHLGDKAIDADAVLVGADTISVIGGNKEAVRDALRKFTSAPEWKLPQLGAIAKVRSWQPIWLLNGAPDEWLLSANANHPRALRWNIKCTATPEPLPTNIFARKTGTNTLERLFDNATRRAEDCVMWNRNQVVTLTISFPAPVTISRVRLLAWWARTSSKGWAFQVRRIIMQVSGKGFERTMRTLAEIVDENEHGDWGAPGYAPEEYTLKPSKPAKDITHLRITVEPRDGTAIYIAELEIWGMVEDVERFVGIRARNLMHSEITGVAVADINGDRMPEVLTAHRSGKVKAFSIGNGELLWETATGSPCHSICATDANDDGRAEIYVGLDDALLSLDGNGNRRWLKRLEYYKRIPTVRVLFTADVNGDGKLEIIAGADNWRFHIFSDEGEKLWHYESVHPSTCGTAADIDGDGKVELLLGTHYYWWHCVDSSGKRLWRYSTRAGPIATAVTTADVDGDGKCEVFFGGADGVVHALSFDGKLLWLFNTGDEITALCKLDVNNDGKVEVITASMSGNIYAFNAQGKCIWRCELPDMVTDVAIAQCEDGDAFIGATCANGTAWLISRMGKVLARCQLPSPPVHVKAIAPHNAQTTAFIVTCTDGAITALPFKETK